MNIQRNDPETRELKQLLDTPEPEWVRERMSQVYASLPPRQESAPPLRRARRAGRTLLIAAALGCCLSLSALAASGELGRMTQNLIGFFHGESAESQSTTYQPMAALLEAHSLQVGQEQSQNGLTVRVDEISVDHNFINVFSTFTSETPFAMDENLPDRLSSGLSSQFSFMVDGQEVTDTVYSSDLTQGYLVDEHTYKSAQRFVASQPLPDTFTLELRSPRYYDEEGEHLGKFMGVTGQWDFTIPVDISDLGRKEIPAQTLTFGSGKLELSQFSASALGTVARFEQPQAEQGPMPENAGPAEGYLWADQIILRDDQGSYLQPVPLQGYSSVGTYASEYVGLSKEASAITFLPYTLEGTSRTETAPLEEGSKLATNSLSGYTIRSVSNTRNGLTLTLEPYGPLPRLGSHALELWPCDSQGNRSELPRCLMESTVDRTTGLVSYTLSYYEPFEGWEQISQLAFLHEGTLTLQEGEAVTLPLG